MNIPCLKKKGLKIFSPTADQRHSLGEDIFCRTHYPLSYRRFRGTEYVEKWTEDKVLEHLMDNNSVVGNRVFVLFGAAGSGKSESLRSIEIGIKKKNAGKKTFRISRTELDPVNILANLVSETGDMLNKAIKDKWANLKQKPVSLANALVWDTLNAMLNSDETIIPLSYKIRPLVENSLRRSFCKDGSGNAAGKVDILSLEEWEEIERTCAFDFNLNYEQFRHRLIDKFEAEVLGGYDFVKTIGEVGCILFTTTGCRPVILIDDLVQSMSIYASDLLDYFITLEEGNWDVLIGLTPASFETSKRGRELLQRISYLDTFDDRIYKLWLTDELGQESYTIDNNNITDYVKQYLLEFKRMNGFNCGSGCKQYERCLGLHWDNDEDVSLTPLNGPLLIRFNDNLFKGKGKPRNILVTVADFLLSIMEGQHIDFLSNRVNREKSCNHHDVNQKVLIDSYLPLCSSGVIKPPNNYYKILCCKPINKGFLNITDLKDVVQVEGPIYTEMQDSFQPKPEIAAIRDWLELKRPNKELLRKFRFACYSFIREFWPKSSLLRNNTSRYQGVVRCDQYYEGCRLPLQVEGIDKFDGITIKRRIGTNAYLLFGLKEQKPEVQKEYLNRLLPTVEVANLIWEAKTESKKWESVLDDSLGKPIAEVAFLLHVFAYYNYSPTKYPLIFEEKYHKGSLVQLLGKWEHQYCRPDESLLSEIDDLFKDWFQLRENLYDAFLIKTYMDKYPDINSVLKTIIEVINESTIPCDYKIRDRTLSECFSEIANSVGSLLYILDNPEFNREYELMIDCLNDCYSIRDSDFELIEQKMNLLKNKCADIGASVVFAKPHIPETIMNNHNNNELFSMITTLHEVYNDPAFSWFMNFKMQLESLCLECKSYIEAICVDLEFKSVKSLEKQCGQYINLMNLIETTIEGLDETKKILSKVAKYKEVSQLVEPDYVDSVKNFYEFVDKFSIHITGNERDFEEVYYLKDLSFRYLMLVQDAINIDDLLDQIDLLFEVKANLSHKKMISFREKACADIVKQMEYINILIPGKDNKEDTDHFLPLLKEVSSGELYKYKVLLNLISIRKSILEDKVSIITSKLQHVDTDKIEKLLCGQTIQISTYDYQLLKELYEKVPSLSDVLKFEIKLNINLGENSEWTFKKDCCGKNFECQKS
jgi:hypothetical protein